MYAVLNEVKRKREQAGPKCCCYIMFNHLLQQVKIKPPLPKGLSIACPKTMDHPLQKEAISHLLQKVLQSCIIILRDAIQYLRQCTPGL